MFLCYFSVNFLKTLSLPELSVSLSLLPYLFHIFFNNVEKIFLLPHGGGPPLFPEILQYSITQ